MEYREVLLVVRIWRSQRRLKAFGHDSTLFPVMIVMIEYAAVYSSALTAAIATYATQNNLQFIAFDLVRYEHLFIISCAESQQLFTIQLTSLVVSRHIFVILTFWLSHVHQGIVFTFIIVRVALGISLNGSSSPQPQQPVTHALPRFCATVTTRYQGGSGDYSVKPMISPFSVDAVHHSDTES